MLEESRSGASAERLIIRSAAAPDLPLVLALIKELAEYERLEHTVVATEKLLGEALFGARPAAEVILAILDAEPVGFAVFFSNFSTFLGRAGLYLEDLYVRPSSRGCGIGRELLRSLARLAKQRGGSRVEWSVLAWNEPAIAFYNSLGAKQLDDWRMFRLGGAALDRLAAGNPRDREPS